MPWNLRINNPLKVETSTNNLDLGINLINLATQLAGQGLSAIDGKLNVVSSGGNGGGGGGGGNSTGGFLSWTQYDLTGDEMTIEVSTNLILTGYGLYKLELTPFTQPFFVVTKNNFDSPLKIAYRTSPNMAWFVLYPDFFDVKLLMYLGFFFMINTEQVASNYL